MPNLKKQLLIHNNKNCWWVINIVKITLSKDSGLFIYTTSSINLKNIQKISNKK